MVLATVRCLGNGDEGKTSKEVRLRTSAVESTSHKEVQMPLESLMDWANVRGANDLKECEASDEMLSPTLPVYPLQW